MNSRASSLGLILLGVFLSIGISLGGYFIGQTMYNAKVAVNTAEAKGLAEKKVEANIANWKISYIVTGKSKKDLPNLYIESENNQKIIIDLIKENGFNDSEIKIGVTNYLYEEFRDKNQKLVDEKHQLVGKISIETTKVKKVSEVRTKLNKLIAQGIDIQNEAPLYRFTKLNEIKPSMLKEATKNARIAANEFATNAGVHVSGIKSARQGNFLITDSGENYGDLGKIEKNVRVVTTIIFTLD